MRKFIKHTGLCVPFFNQNVDTDQIVPKKFLLRVERTGFGEALFYDLRFNGDGSPNEEFILNDPHYQNGSILLTGANFGCGSSREHAPWALAEYGFRVIIAPSFADIFYNNCFKTGLLPIVLKSEIVKDLVIKSKENEQYKLMVDLETQSVSDNLVFGENFSINKFRKHCLINGLDDIDLTLLHEDKISKFEKKRVSFLPLQL